MRRGPVLRTQTYMEPVQLKHGKLATNIRSYRGYFLECALTTVHNDGGGGGGGGGSAVDVATSIRRRSACRSVGVTTSDSLYDNWPPRPVRRPASTGHHCITVKYHHLTRRPPHNIHRPFTRPRHLSPSSLCVAGFPSPPSTYACCNTRSAADP